MLKKNTANRYSNFRVTLFIISFIVFSMWMTNSVLANELIVLTEEIGEYPLGLYLEILEDKDGKLTLDDVRRPEMENRWVKSNLEVPNYGYTKSVYWTRFKLQFSKNEKYYLEIAYPHLDVIDFYTFTSSQNVIHKKSGDFLSFKERDIKYRNFTFLLVSDNDLEKEYYIRFESESSIQFPMRIWSPISFAEKKNKEMIGIGLYFGVMLVMALYNFFIWIFVKDKSYFYYVAYILLITFYLSNYYGLTIQYLLRISPYLYNLLFIDMLLLANLAMLAFTSNLLQISKNIPQFFNFYKCLILSLTFGTIFLSTFVSYRLSMLIAILIVIASFVWCLSVGIIMVKRKYRPARFYLLAWSAFLFGGILNGLKATGILPVNLVTEYSVQFGSALEVILLSLGLADRINDLKKENEFSQARALDAEKRASKIKDEFLANLSHELRTPLTTVFAYSEMLENNEDYPEEVREYSKEIHSGANKLNEYVNDLILLTDIESNLRIHKARVDLVDLISSAVEENKPLLDTKEIKLEFNLPGKIEIECDAKLLEKVISSIVKNAIVYNKQCGQVQIYAAYKNTDQEQGIEIRIADLGIGIGKEHYEKVFEKFFRIDSALTYEVSGVGIGLYLARKIIELHRGYIEVESELGVGSTFTINLPTGIIE